MPSEDIAFQTTDNVTVRGWFYTPSSPSSTPLPCLILSHGFTGIKEMDLNTFAEHFVSSLPLTCLVYDNRGFGTSDHAPSAPRHEIIPYLQCSDISDAITYAQTRSEVDKEKIGLWGTSYSGGHVLQVAATDKRVKVVLSQVPFVDGFENFHRLIRADFVGTMNGLFEADRLARAAGTEAMKIPVVDQNPMATSALPTPDSYTFFNEWRSKSDWKNEVTVKTMEELRAYNPSAQIHNISPTPLLMTIATHDVLCPSDLAIKAYSRALEPKELHLLQGSHFDGYSGPNFEKNAGRQVEFLRKTLCA